MKKRLLLLSLLSMAAFNAVLAAPPSYIQTENGIIAFTDPVFTGTSRAVKLEVVVATPFLVFPKNYGIPWDNSSLTRAGDVRPFHQLSNMHLFSKKDEPGWLTASYDGKKVIIKM